MAPTIDQFNVVNVVFDEVTKYTTGDISDHRIPIKYLVDLCIATPDLVT